MPRYAAFLRAINVGGRRVTNDELRACVATLGFDDVATFRASGNVIFGDPAGQSIGVLGRRLEECLGDSLGYAVPVFVREARQMRAIAGHQPFDAETVRAAGGRLQVLLMTSAPKAAARKAALALATDGDRLATRGSELYWLPSGGMMDSLLDLKALEQIIGMTTMRTKGTMDLIAAKHFAS